MNALTRGETIWVDTIFYLNVLRYIAIMQYVYVCDWILVKRHFLRNMGFSVIKIKMITV